MIKINGYWYTHQEVTEALRKKGYAIAIDEYEPDKRGNVKTEWIAIKNGKSQNMESAAIAEFHKKPPLI